MNSQRSRVEKREYRRTRKIANAQNFAYKRGLVVKLARVT